MHVQWELWDDESGNLIYTYDTEAEALAQVREFVQGKSDVVAEGLSLIMVAADGQGGVVASDAALATRARHATLVVSSTSSHQEPFEPVTANNRPGHN